MTTPAHRDLRVRVTRLKRFDDLRAFLGWTVLLEAFAWDEAERRWRPAPFVYDVGLFGWRHRARVFRDADVDDLIDYVKARERAVTDRPTTWRAHR